MLVTPGLIAALGIFILLLKLRKDTLRKLLGFDIYIDIGVTLILMWAFAGTFAGMMAAMVGGIAFSIALYCLKVLLGYKQLTVVNDSDHLLPALRWEERRGLARMNRARAKRGKPPMTAAEIMEKL